MPAAFTCHGAVASGSNTPTGLPPATPAVDNTPAATRPVSASSSVPAATAKPAPVSTIVCLSSSHSSLTAANAMRYTGPASPAPAYSATGSVARYPVNSSVPASHATTTRPRRTGTGSAAATPTPPPSTSVPVQREGAFSVRSTRSGASAHTASL